MSAPSASPRSRVLIADDDPHILALLRRVVIHFGLEPLEATDGASAVAAFASASLGCVAIILDHSMPLLTGVEAAVAIREMEPTVPIVITSGYLNEAGCALLALLPHTTFLAKPYQLSEVYRLLASYLVSE
jgi:CheY-like chemotaxis protein